MSENAAPGKNGANGADASAAGMPFYEKQRQHLKELIARKRALEKRMTSHEEAIYQKETDYLENTPGGNIITGFDNYTKGASTAAAQRRKMGMMDQNRVFSKSSISYNANAEAQTPGSLGSTPGSHAPTPVSASFNNTNGNGNSSGNNGGSSGSNGNSNNKDGASSAATPSSATAPGKAAGPKKTKKAAAAAAAAAAAGGGGGGGGEDSETDGRETKKVRTAFGAVRK